ncbi:hypothetical protein [Kitasatospora sp. NPDC058046]|uniref:hypothetical protein n=1 Tax=Kitasatospora sp. NPDC058046 TaxID=3346312 RepID=UPI0036D87C56
MPIVNVEAVEHAFTDALLADAATWDRPNLMGLVEQRDDGRIELLTFDIPGPTWTYDGGKPHQVLLALAQMLASSPAELNQDQRETLHRDTENTVGVWFYNDAWETPAGGSPDAVRRVKTAGADPPIGEDLDHIESKAINAVLFGHIHRAVRLRRGNTNTDVFPHVDGPVAYPLAMACLAIEQRRTRA